MLFLVLDPFGNLPLFLTILGGIEKENRTKVFIREMLIALGILFFFLFLGGFILALFHIKGPSLSIAGGILMFLIALKMIFPEIKDAVTKKSEELFIVPLAVPLIAGPSSIATVMLLVSREPGRIFDWSLALLGAWGGTVLILSFSEKIRQLLGQKVIQAFERLMGMVFLIFAVDMFLAGLKEFLENIDR
jgi:multiple antibiotic resistance protein